MLLYLPGKMFFFARNVYNKLSKGFKPNNLIPLDRARRDVSNDYFLFNQNNLFLNMDNNMKGENSQKQQIAILQEDEDGISVPNWLFEVLAWISRIEMANSQLSFSCKLFKQLCWPKLHENVEPHKINHLEFNKGRPTNSDYFLLNKHQILPIPIVPPPSYILGFNYINIQFLDDQFLEFVQNILPRLNKIKFSVGMHFYRWTLEERRTKDFRRLLDLLADKIVKFIFHRYPARVSEFNLLFPGFIQKVNFLCACPIPEEFDILFDWLALWPINGEKQKILKLETTYADEYCTDKFIDRIKEEFSKAYAPINYFIKCQFDSRFAHFNMENEKTGETLTLYPIAGQQNYNYIVRCPKGEEDFWKKEGQRKMKEYWNHDDGNETYIYISAQIDNFEN